MIIGLYSIDLYKTFNFWTPLSTSFSRFSKCTVKGCYLEGTFWISSNLYKSANFCLRLETKVLKCSYVQVKIEWINSKDKVYFLVQVTFFCNLEPFLLHVRGIVRARPRYADADSANLRAIFADRKQKSFKMVKKSTCKISAL